MPRSTKRYLQSYLKNPQWNFSLQKTTTTMKEKNKTKKNVLICALLRIKKIRYTETRIRNPKYNVVNNKARVGNKEA